MTISILIPTINEPTLEKVIQSAQRELPDAEIIVIGYGTSKETAIKNSVKFLDTHTKTPKPVGINKAVTLAKHEWVIVLDADAIPLPGWGNGMLSAFRSGKQGFHGSLDMSYGNFWMKVYNFSSSHELLPENKPEQRKNLPACNLGFTKEAYMKGGKWDESLLRSQDYEWTMRLNDKGITLWFEPTPAILHIANGQSTFKAVWNSWVRNGYYNWLIRKKYAHILKTPVVLRSPFLVLLLSPILSIVPTLRIAKTSPKNFIRYLYLLPFVYLTKIAWCIGVYQGAQQNQK
ncbi:MAG: glycosyltransferase [Anaerolineae bacterium]|nr:glycosyltransferase [Anaerolineae bacterium]